jgi:hypothetical protein
MPLHPGNDARSSGIPPRPSSADIHTVSILCCTNGYPHALLLVIGNFGHRLALFERTRWQSEGNDRTRRD